MPDRHEPRRGLVTAGVLLGIGLGGFLDGIVFHQVLQLHHLLSAKLPKTGVDDATALVNLQINMFWDGLFHLATWGFTAAGLFMLWRALVRMEARPSGRRLLGAMSIGWGLFNLVEGVVDHHVLQIHHVVEALGPSAWDVAFLVSGAVLMVLGGLLVRGSDAASASRRAGPLEPHVRRS